MKILFLMKQMKEDYRLVKLTAVIDGEFKPLSFSIPRFEEKIETLENNLEKTGRKGKDLYVDEENMFPESELEDIMDLLEDGDLNGAISL